MKLQLIRHATLWLQYAGLNLLIDPMFSSVGVNPPIALSGNKRRNPLVPLPAAYQHALQPDAVIVTHLHQDHWDEAAAEVLSHTTPILCQPGDESTFTASGFQFVTPIQESITIQGVTITRTGGQHGTGMIGKRMGQVSGFVLQAVEHPTLYIAGDTVWCDEVKHALDAYHPQVTIVNAGGARFVMGGPITMDANDVVKLCRYAPYTKVAAVHMDTINHCLVTRADLRQRIDNEGLQDQVMIPEDGEWI
ncbi:MBL fold metallo-hydrolase [Paenibacillus albiflavus]|uniref:MBL fold metallo-hydrolase n=1 Tax=Paenibacillus albiflavus TaxID=2545760 RepID=A0A4R4E9T5_9BACL|nr:MBL fold metallo-hydrolase [Paenibacillus albiflavus]TCZ76626.1 MBL fold metallo-hydrolase [Paenibacillus albiflavus]